MNRHDRRAQEAQAQHRQPRPEPQPQKVQLGIVTYDIIPCRCGKTATRIVGLKWNEALLPNVAFSCSDCLETITREASEAMLEQAKQAGLEKVQ
jgi:hypothetical protein